MAGKIRVYNFKKQPLDRVPFHKKPGFKLTRFVLPKIAGAKTSVHIIKFAKKGEDYCRPHKHSFGEINRLVAAPKGGLVYKIMLGKKTFSVKAPARIGIPAGTMHSANAIKGSGLFICVRLEGKGSRKKKPAMAKRKGRR